MSWSSRRFMAGVITFILLISVWVLVYLPPYEKIVFWNSKACGYDAVRQNPYNFEGYKGGDGFPVIDATAVSQSIPQKSDGYFVLKIAAENLEPMGIYCPAAYSAADTAYETNVWKVMLLRTSESYAQYYMALFANGEEIPVRINNRIVSIPRIGEILLPIGQVHMDSALGKVYQGNLTDDWYIDAVSGFENSHDMKQFYRIRDIVAVILFIIAVISVMVWMIKRKKVPSDKKEPFM